MRLLNNIVLVLIKVITIAGIPQQTLRMSNYITNDIAEEANLDFLEIANKYGQRTEEYAITSEDGYILKMFRLVGDESRPVLLVHGAVDSSNSFIMRGNTSLSIQLAQDNYDVWAVNYRGNNHSRRHVKLNPDTDKAFWDFSIHEIGYYDMPAIIDFVLKSTGQQTLSAIGYSEGTTALYVLGILRPEYNEKIKIFISLASVCYMQDLRESIASLSRISTPVNTVFESMGVNEIFGYFSIFRSTYELLCKRKDAYDLCITNVIFLLAGADPEEIEPEFGPVIVGHWPAGSSRKNLYHLAQIGRRRRFAMFDYGPKENIARYKTKTPPEYDLSKLTMKIALIAAKNDPISTIKNVNLLRNQLPNVVEYRVMASDTFSHGTYVWGRNTHKTMHPHIFEILDKYK